MNVLVTGGAGYIGSHVAYLLIENGYNVTVLDNLSRGDRKLIPKKANFVKCDISNRLLVEKLLKKINFTAVLHFAGYIRVDESIKMPQKYILNNYKKTKNFS